MWLWATLACLLLDVVVCPAHWRMYGITSSLGNLEHKEAPTEAVKSYVKNIEEEFKTLIRTTNINTAYRAISFRKKVVSGTLYFVKVSGDGPDGEIFAILRIFSTVGDKKQTLEGFVLLSQNDTIEYFRKGVNINYVERAGGPSPELPATRQVKAIVANSRAVLYPLLKNIKHSGHLKLRISDEILDAVSYKEYVTLGTHGYYIKARVYGYGDDQRHWVVYVVLHIDSLGGQLFIQGVAIMDAYGSIPVKPEHTLTGTNDNGNGDVSRSVVAKQIAGMMMTSYIVYHL